MSILKKPYEISIWRDEWDQDEEKFVEKRIQVIGSNEMTSQARVLEPNLVTNINGVKSLSFKIYSQYIDIISGEKTTNPFVQWLVNERKVKLYYEDKWYDFIIKDITENSSTYLNTYQLEDALVLELAKNGFDIVLDTELMNNTGTAEELAKQVLKETDWKVESETFVEIIEEPLVYVTLPITLDKNVYRLVDSREDYFDVGLTEEEYTAEEATELFGGKTALAFYSSCRNKPYRFQFLLLDDYGKDKVQLDSNNCIQTDDCQYYIEYNITDYNDSEETSYGLILPQNFQVLNKTYEENISDSTISTWYRGGRYGFSQKRQYVPLLKKYCKVYQKDSTEFYENEVRNYDEPSFGVNVVSNTLFENTTGWKGVSLSGNKETSAEIENVFGVFKNNKFVSIINQMTGDGAIDNMTIEEFLDQQEVSPYLKVILKSEDDSAIINSGPFDNRTLIGNMEVGSKWAFRIEYFNSNGGKEEGLSWSFEDITYSVGDGAYKTSQTIKLEQQEIQDDYVIYKVTEGFDTQENFVKNCNLKIVIKGIPNTYYIKNMEFFRARFDEEQQLIPLNQQGNILSQNGFTTSYKYFQASQLDRVLTEQDLSYDMVVDNLSLSYQEGLKPVYNFSGEKIRAVTIKESNYFNILQSIAETFECWLHIYTLRDDYGGIISKTICLNNFSGEDNYAVMRKDVNVKDIQRSYSSQNITTKLIVKPNNNEHGKDGICLVSRAKSNPSGEDNLYDFQYFQNIGLMDANEYIDAMYKIDGAKGSDINIDHASIISTSKNYIGNTVKDDNNIYCTIDFEWTQDFLNTLAENFTENSVQEYTIMGKISWKTSSGKVLDEKGNPQIGLGLSLSTSHRLLDNEVIIKFNDNEWSNIFTFTITDHGSLNISNGVWNPGIYFYEMRKNEEEEWVSGRSTTEWDELFYGTKSAGAYGLEYFDVDFYLIATKTITNVDENYDNLKTKGKFVITNTENPNMQGYYPRIRSINDKLEIKNAVLNEQTQKISQLTSELAVQEARNKASIVGIEDSALAFETLTGIKPSAVVGNTIQLQTIELLPINKSTEIEIEEKHGYISYSSALEDFTISITTSLRTKTITITAKATDAVTGFEATRNLYILAYPKLTLSDGTTAVRNMTYMISLVTGQSTASQSQNVGTIDLDVPDVQSYFYQYGIHLQSKQQSEKEMTELQNNLENEQQLHKNISNEIKILKHYKILLNKIFFSRYSRFILEGTWIDEQYYDDEKYYIDALSVLYQSCYPQAAYTINTYDVSQLPGYELFKFNLGDKTYIEDGEFFGYDKDGNPLRVEVIIAEKSENLDEPNKNTSRVQNFKTAFQDLFQKITATTQEIKYSTGKYEKGATLAMAIADDSVSFLTETLDEMTANLSNPDLVSEAVDKSSQLRIVDGKLLIGLRNEETEEISWRTGISSKGISASLITAGKINTKEIQIMSGESPTFRWDSKGISAYDYTTFDNVISGVNTKKFVRFDKYGIYGINDKVDGFSWTPSGEGEIHDLATFALTWQGLTVKGTNNAVVNIGFSDTGMIKVNNGTFDTFVVDSSGNVTVRGNLQIGNSGTTVEDYVNNIGGNNLYTGTQDFSGWGVGSEAFPTWAISSDKIDKYGNSAIYTTDLSSVSPYKKVPVKKGETYTFSATVFQDESSPYYIEIWFVEDIDNYMVITDYDYDALNGETRVSGTYTTQKEGNLSVWIQAGSKSGGSSYFTISSFKLERGFAATDWRFAQSELTLSNVNTNNFSWKFSPTEGMYMWNGSQTEEPVFKIYNNDGVHELVMRGTMIASTFKNNESSIYLSTTPLGGDASDSNAVLKITDKFYVTQDGEIYSTSGHFGAWECDEFGFSYFDTTGEELFALTPKLETVFQIGKAPELLEENIGQWFSKTIALAENDFTDGHNTWFGKEFISFQYCNLTETTWTTSDKTNLTKTFTAQTSDGKEIALFSISIEPSEAELNSWNFYGRFSFTWDSKVGMWKFEYEVDAPYWFRTTIRLGYHLSDYPFKITRDGSLYISSSLVKIKDFVFTNGTNSRGGNCKQLYGSGRVYGDTDGFVLINTSGEVATGQGNDRTLINGSILCYDVGSQDKRTRIDRNGIHFYKKSDTDYTLLSLKYDDVEKLLALIE